MISILTLCFSTFYLNGQTIEELQEEIENLNNELNFYKSTVEQCKAVDSLKTIVEISSFHADYDFKFVSAEGNKNDQSVLVTFLVNHSLVNQQLSMNNNINHGNAAYDINGNVYEISINNQFPVIPFETSVKVQVKIYNVLPGTTRLEKLMIQMKTENNSGKRMNNLPKSTVFNNIIVNW